jgi:hypothetical protein
MVNTLTTGGQHPMKKSKKVRAVDTKMAAANDKAQAETPAVTKEVPTVAPPAKNESAVKKGARYAGLAGRPSSALVRSIFGSKGYQMSWETRAKLMDMKPEELCELFKTEAEREALKVRWDSLTTKPSK